MKTRSLYCAVLPLLVGITYPKIGLSQSTSQLHGIVTDPQGAVIASARVTLSSTGTGFNRQAAANANGEYQFLQVPPGTYNVTVEMAGFASLSRTDVQLLVNTPTTLDFRMEVASATQTVDVAAEASAINTVDASVGNAFSEQQVRDLPLQTRNVVQLLSLQPGSPPMAKCWARAAIPITSPSMALT